jgi:hypothetical protein
VRDAFRTHGVAVPGDRVLPRRWYARLARFSAMLAPPDLRKALSTLPIYLDYLADSQAFDDSEFTAWLAAQGRKRPAPAAYLHKVLEHYFATRYGTPSPRD